VATVELGWPADGKALRLLAAELGVGTADGDGDLVRGFAPESASAADALHAMFQLMVEHARAQGNDVKRRQLVDDFNTANDGRELEDRGEVLGVSNPYVEVLSSGLKLRVHCEEMSKHASLKPGDVVRIKGKWSPRGSIHGHNGEWVTTVVGDVEPD